jgi:nitrate reductase gamma subunit
MRLLLWVVLPYVAMAVFVLGHLWRYRYDKFGWTTRSSQLYENRLLRWGSPLFHFGILVVAVGHVAGLFVPAHWTEQVGISESVYHNASYALGAAAGLATVAGMAILVYRRRTVGPVFSATTRNDKAMYVLLAAALLSGLATVIATNVTGHPHDYRATVSPWFRSIFEFDPQPDLITAAPWGFRVHAVLAWLLIVAWPFTRLVHVFSAPIGYLTRPYIPYRSREATAGLRAGRRGWDRADAGGRR